MKRLAAAIAVLVLVAIAAVAQDAAEEARSDNGFLVNLLENRLSSPGRQIRLSGISGALSSRAKIGQITVSDDQGVWLRIDNAEIDWSRLALLRGRVNVNRLTAERIAWLRPGDPPPQPARKLPTAEAQPFSLPELPVAINVKEVALPSISFGESVFGQAAEFKVAGSFNLTGGALDTLLEIDRLDAPGGSLDLKAAFSNATRQLELDVALQEPQGGVVATLLGIEGTPAIDLRLQGSGPLDQVDVTFSLDAGGARIAEGVVALRSSDDGLGFDIDFGGSLSPLVPREFRDFFAGQSSIQVQGVKKAAGGVRIDELMVTGAVLDLSGSLETGADNFLRDLSLTGSLGDPAGSAVTLPVPGGRTRLHSAELYVNFGGASRWDGLLVLDRLQVADIEMEDVTLRLGGLAQNLEDPARRRVTLNAEGLATGVWAAEPAVARALGTRIDLFADAAFNSGGPIDIRQFQVSGNGLSIFSAGSISDFVYTGRNAVRIADLAIFAGLADRPLSGGIDLSADGSISPLTGGFDLTFDGHATDLGLGNARLDRLAAGETRLSGRAVRDETGFRTEDLRLENPQLSFASNGQISTTRTDIGFEAAVADLSLVAPRASGRLTASGHATGQGRPISVTLSAAIPEGALLGRDLHGAQVGFAGEVNGTDVSGSLSGDATLGGLVMRLAGDVSAVGERRAVSGLEFAVGPNRLTGDLVKDGADPVVGKLTLRAPELSSLAALALVEATGSINADIGLDAAPVGQGVTLRVAAEQVAVGDSRIGTLETEASVVDALGVPLVSGTLAARDLALGGLEVASISARAEQRNETAMRFSAEGRLAAGTLVELSGALERLEGGFSATLESLDLRQQGVAARLTAPATITLRDGAIDLTPLGLDIGNGNLTAQGRVAEEIDVNVAIRDLPLGIANAIRPDLALSGTVNGAARIVGPRGAPDLRFNLTAEQMASGMTRDAGLSPIALEASGQTANQTLDLTASVRSRDGLAASAKGKVPLAAGNIDLLVELQAFPMALIDRMAGRRGLRGTLTGRAHVTGPRAEPAVSFDLRGEGLSTRILADNGIRPLGLTAAGSYHRRAIELDRVHATGADGLDIQGMGRIPFAGPGLDVQVEGTVPLSVADIALAERSAQASGLLHVTATARGSLTTPQLGGTVSLAGGTLVDPQTNVRLESISIDAGFDGNAVVLHSFRANVATGGTIAASGRVRLAPGYPADLTAEMRNVRYTDGAFITTRIDGDLAIKGPLVGGGGMLSGEIELGRTEISVAEGLGANAQAALDQVTHVDPPPRVKVTLERAKVGQSRAAETRAGPGIGLDIRISAPNQIFVRGRGLDVELGGAMRVQGTTTDVRPIGQFDLRRGRLAILGQRIDFDEGSLQLIGDLDPLIHLVAKTRSGDVTAIVTVNGRVSAPEISFSSQPPLPEDEVLSRVLFNRATQDLSAFQVAQLAAAAAELAGGGGPGILSQLRGATGLDDLDIVTQEDGSTAVRAGKYIDENIYLDVQTGTDGVSRAEINLDVSNNLTARGSVGTDGNTTLGLFFERDY